MLLRLSAAVSKFIPAGLAFTALLATAAAGSEQGIGPFTGPEADAEAARLYANAVALVRNVNEGDYSYAYIQFHWKRAGANVDRVVRAYPSSPTATRLKSGEDKLGTFSVDYFKECVLPRLEEKKVSAFDAVNNAIFLYNLETNTDEAGKRELLATIVQTLCRQIRWGEALAFPVLDADRPWLWNLVVGQAVIYHNDKLAAELLGNIPPANKPRLLATAAEGLGFRGATAEEFTQFLTDHGDTPELRAAFFRGAARRDLPIALAVEQKRPLKGLYDGVDGIQKTEDRGDVPAAYAALAADAQALARPAHAAYLAGLGKWDEARALGAPAAALSGPYFDYLVLHERYGDALALAGRLGPDADLAALLFALRRAARPTEAAQVEQQLAARIGAERAAYVAFRGHLFSTDDQLVAREKTFSDLPIRDPNLIGRLVCEWSLTPNRTLRGAAPWDAITFKFAPGFENLTPPKDKRKVEAAGR